MSRLRMSSSKPLKLSDPQKPGVARTLFVSDLHLCESRPEITHLFLKFLQSSAIGAQALYILGDLFEYWAGDDALEGDVHYQQVVNGIQQLVQSGTPVFFMHGNRDLLVGTEFARQSGAQLLPDPVLIDLHGRQTLLTHGDALCTDDVEYQAFRRQVREAQWQQSFLAQPLASRTAQIQAFRQRSEQEKSHKSMRIMDVNTDAVAALVRQFSYPSLLIHGHTHRMGQHQIRLPHAAAERIVLGDWYDTGNYLECTSAGCEFVACLPQPLDNHHS